MAKSVNQKCKILYILKILSEQTDEDHPITTAEIITQLANRDIHAERKSIYNDIEQLIQFGYDIIQLHSRQGGGYYLASREFELAELKLLVDAVQSTRFITLKKSRELIGKLQKLTSSNEAGALWRQVYVVGRSKAENEGIYYNVDAIHKAIQKQTKLQFQYLEWNLDKILMPRKKGKLYVVSPWALLWQEENYYLVAYESESQMIKHYRVDKIGNVDILDTPREGQEYFDELEVAQYSRQTFGMFGGKEEIITLRLKNHLVGVVLDRFGKEITLKKFDEENFSVRLSVAVSQQFFGWLTGLGKDACIVAPKNIMDSYKEYLMEISRNY